jgi:hypothetical protein
MIDRRRAVGHSEIYFGRSERHATSSAQDSAGEQSRMSDDLRLFALTFVGGFLFVSVYLF